ncbi:MAG: hypothetical protein HY319_17955 [Armatimonadetes bacterium]|nr:hypothetical protein [Armatimonadota bacterium]
MAAQLLSLALGFVLWFGMGRLAERCKGVLRLFVRALRGGVLGVIFALLAAIVLTHLSPSRVAHYYFPALAAGLSLIGMTIGTLGALFLWKRQEQPAEQAQTFAARLREAGGETEPEPS